MSQNRKKIVTDFNQLPKIFNRHFAEMKNAGHSITALTAYDYPTAKLVDHAGVELILVGDSLRMVVQGKSTTLGVTLEEMIYHCKMVSEASSRAMVCLDMPFLSYQVNQDEAVYNAGRSLTEGGAGSVKIEGACGELIARLVETGIPVLAHLGFTPQSYHQFGGYGIIGKNLARAEQLVEEAIAVEQAGAYAVVLECIPDEVAGTITKLLTIPTIGIGSGPHCNGQILVFHDIFGLYPHLPKHVKVYQDLGKLILEGVEKYIGEVRQAKFPSAGNYYKLEPDVLREWKKLHPDD